MHVLIVEDDPMNALVMSKILTRMGGHEVTVLESVEHVRALVKEGTVDVVVMDVSLANTTHEGRAINGVEFTRLLKSDDGHLPVVLATAHAMRGDAERLIQESGADGYVSKPINDPQAFISTVDATVRGAPNSTAWKR